jgi:FdhD protein
MNPRDASTEPHDPMRRTAKRAISAWRDGAQTPLDDLLAGEEPMQILLAGAGSAPIEVAVTMRTPGNDNELAVGFLVSEGLINAADVERVAYADPVDAAQPENHLVVHLKGAFDTKRIVERTTIASASCGICGKASIDDVVGRCAPVVPTARLSAAALGTLPSALRTAQPVFDRTGGLHAAALVGVGAGGAVQIEMVREDVGRHNAVDKLIGAAALAHTLPLTGRLLLLSGRCSFELVQKAAAAGIGAIACIGAPSDLAVETAEGLGICLIGFLRENSLNVYTERERVSA